MLRPVPDLPPATGCVICHGIVRTKKGGRWICWGCLGDERRRKAERS